MAIDNLVLSLKEGSHGKPLAGEYRTTLVFLKQGDIWKQVSFRSTGVH
jgi:hypothetical protein